MNEELLEELNEFLEMLKSDSEFVKEKQVLPTSQIIQNYYDDLKEIVDKYK